MRVQGDYGNPIHGVSRQADSRMFPGQCREQINCRSDLTTGLQNRNGWEYVSKLVGLTDRKQVINLDGAMWRSHERGDGTATITAYAPTSPAIFDTKGKSLPFRFGTVGSGSGVQPVQYYLSGGSDMKNKFGISSVLDTVFMTNRKVIPVGGNLRDKVEPLPHRVWIKFSTFTAGSTWNIEVDGFSFDAKSDTEGEPNFEGIFDGWISGTADKTDPDIKRVEEYNGTYQAKVFYDKLSARARSASYSVVLYNDYVMLYQATSGQAPISVKINEGGESIKVTENRNVKAIEDLPEIALGNSYARVIEGQGEERSTGYFKANLRAGNEGGSRSQAGIVSWKEVAAPSSVGTITANSMPHRIRYQDASHGYVFEQMDWPDRRSGDKDSNPYNSFILNKKPIQAIGLFQNRMFYAAGETIATSAVDNYQDLWLESSFYNTDADPFEVYADTDKLNVIQYAAELDGDLVFFSGNGQFLMSGETPQTYKTAQVTSVAQYSADLLSNPVQNGDNIMFATSIGSFAGIREFYTEDVAATKKARPITDHVNDYMRGRIRHMTSSTSIDALAVLLEDNKDEIYLYEWRWEGKQKQQQSWYKWTMPTGFEAEWIGFIAGELYLVVKHGAEYLLWKMKWQDVDRKFDLPFSPCLDSMIQITGTYDPAARRTTFNTPYQSAEWTFYETKGSDAPGFNLTLEHLTGTEYVIEGDYSSITLLAGIPVETYWSMTLPRVVDKDGITQEIDRLQLGKLHFHFDKVGKIDYKTSDSRGRGRGYTFINRRMNNPANRLNVITVDKGSWEVPIRKRVKDLTLELSSSYITPWVLRGVEWEGDYNQKGRRI